MNIYLDMFLTFARVGACTFGGGYAMLPILQREVVEKKGWAVNEDLTDYYAIGQCTPGIIAVNTAIFLGHKMKGVAGGVVAALGVVTPSILVITVIAAFLANFADYPLVQHALAGVNACVVALIAHSVVKLGKSNLKNAVQIGIFLAVLLLGALEGLNPMPGTGLDGILGFLASPVTLVVMSAVAGLLLFPRVGGGKEDKK